VAAQSSSEESRLETGRSGDLSPEQDPALAAWRHRSNLPILLAAIVPLVVTSPQVRAVSFAVGVGSWLVFLGRGWIPRDGAGESSHRMRS
jgi:hypothetical protein